MKVLSLFSGVGGFDLGLERAGMQTIYQCEWDKHATNILNRHWPDVPKWGDITTLTAQEILSHGQMPDVVAWGSPCQDLSVAGFRAGLAGKRSGLFYEGIRIIKELRKETNNAYPRFSIWENVAGALSSNGGADFGEVLNEMAEAGALVIEWAVLDAQHFGVPQRRRRVFVIAIFNPATANRCPDPLLPVSESLRRDTQTDSKKRQGSSDQIEAGFGVSGFWELDETTGPSEEIDSLEPYLIDRGAFNQGQNAKFDIHISDDPVSPALRATGPHAVAFSHTQGLDPQPSEDAWPTLRSGGAGHAVQTDMAVRRLTPIECERLMGWPDDWTAGQADSHRYKQCGNGVASPVAEWIAIRLRKLDGIQ